KFVVCAFTFSSITSVAALADQPSYSYVEAGYHKINIDGFDSNPDGYYLKGSVALSESGFLRGEFANAEDDLEGVDYEVDALMIGIGYQQPMGENSSIYAVADYLEAEADADGFESVDENGFQVAGGVRGFVADNFELGAEIGYADVEEADGFVGTISAVFHIASGFGISAAASIDEEDDSRVQIGVRYTF
ncbi:MAG: outer membrane beta-barrel protein, partial [bacterium]